MTETIIERVARAIAEVPRVFIRQDWEPFPPYHVCRDGNPDAGEAEIVVIETAPSRVMAIAAQSRIAGELRARAALEALREPTKVMAEVGDRCVYVGNTDARMIFGAMIAAALI